MRGGRYGEHHCCNRLPQETTEEAEPQDRGTGDEAVADVPEGDRVGEPEQPRAGPQAMLQRIVSAGAWLARGLGTFDDASACGQVLPPQPDCWTTP